MPYLKEEMEAMQEEKKNLRPDVKLPNRSYEQEVIVDTNVGFRQGWGNFKYKPEYCQLAYDILSSGPLKTKAHLCVAFQCSKPTIVSWVKRYPEFREAVEAGLAAGEKKFRDKTYNHAFEPQAQVNNGLIKLLAANVYGIKEEVTPTVVIDQRQEKSAEEIMKERGIPIPELPSPDMDMPNFETTEEEAEAQRDGDELEEESAASESSIEESPHGEAGIAGDGNGRLKSADDRVSGGKLLLELYQLRAQLNEYKKDEEESKKRGIKGFGYDFESTDENVMNPFGDAER